MNRREMLKQAGVAVGAGAAGAAGIVAYSTLEEEHDRDDEEPEPEPPGFVPQRYVDEFETVVDATAAGADANAEVPINDVVTKYADDDTLLAFEPGRYLLEPAVLSDLSTFGIVGVGNERPTIIPVNSTCDPGNVHVEFESLGDLLIENIDVDFKSRDGGGAIQLFARGDARIRNVEITGHCQGQISTLRVDALESDSEVTVENLVAVDENGDSRLTGVYVGKHHAGALTFRNCEIRGFSNNGLYASAPGQPGGQNGVVRVIGGTYANNNIANVRLGTTDSVARGITVNVESPPLLNGQLNARGIRLRERSGQTIENVNITIGPDVGRSLGGIVFHPDAGTALVRDSTVSVDADGIPGIHALFPSDQSFDGPVFDGVTLHGEASRGYAATVIGRDETVFRDCTIDQSGAGRGGILIENAETCTIANSTISADDSPIDLENADAHIQNTRVETPSGSRTIEDMHARNEVVAP